MKASQFDNKEVIVFGQNTTLLLGITRALGSAGYDVNIINMNPGGAHNKVPYLDRCKYAKSCHVVGREDDLMLTACVSGICPPPGGGVDTRR